MISDTSSWAAQHKFLHYYFLVLQIQLLVQFPLQESEYNNQVEKNASSMQISVGRHRKGDGRWFAIMFYLLPKVSGFSASKAGNGGEGSRFHGAVLCSNTKSPITLEYFPVLAGGSAVGEHHSPCCTTAVQQGAQTQLCTRSKPQRRAN